MSRKIIEKGLKGSDFEIDTWKPSRILSKRKMQSGFAVVEGRVRLIDTVGIQYVWYVDSMNIEYGEVK